MQSGAHAGATGLPDPEPEEEEAPAEDPNRADIQRALDILRVPEPVPGQVGIRLPDIGVSPGVLDPRLQDRYEITDEVLQSFERIAQEMQAAAASGESMPQVLDRHGWTVMQYSYVVGRVQQTAMLAAAGSSNGASRVAEVRERITELERRLREHPEEANAIALELNMLRMKLVALNQLGGAGTETDAGYRAETERIRSWLERVERRQAPR